jgi:2-amino-4-hydroxy-6-hydroxymethyldihydropteridine diphosphokinase
MTTTYIGLGSNLGDRLGNLSRAVDAIAHIPDTHVEKVSHAYESAPAYDTDQPSGLNAVVEARSSLEPEALLGFLLDIEADMGRIREQENGPRVVDLDLLTFGDVEQISDYLTLPHPRIAERDFVVTPLLEIAPRFELPGGVHVRRSEALYGAVLRDFGTVPDAGAEHNMPIGEVEWEVVASSSDGIDSFAGFDAALALKREVLATEKIPYAFDPFEPSGDIDTFGLPVTFKLLVPVEHAATARALLAELDAAEMVFPENFEE